MNKVAFITGASRGIGRAIAHRLAREGCHIVVAAKSIEENSKLPGTIYSVADELKKYNVKAFPVQLDVRDAENIKNAVDYVKKEMGGVDILINNAGALWWKSIIETDIKKYNLINNINSRASFLLAKECLPNMIENNWGHIVMHSPPLPDPKEFMHYSKKTAYLISKYGMTMAAMGIAAEFRDTGIAANSVWPATPIQSAAVENTALGNPKMWRKPAIIADTIAHIVNEDPKTFSGNQLIDEEYLMTKGVNDFRDYQCVSGYEPPKLIEIFNKFIV